MPERLLLRLLNGPRAGESFEVPASGLLVGRKAGNDLQLDDPSLSGRHAFLRADGAQVQVEDLGSTNGTKIDGEKIERGTAGVGTVLTLGKLKLAVVGGTEAPASEAAPAAAPSPASAANLDIEGLEEEIVLGEDSESGGTPAAPAIPAISVPPMPATERPPEAQRTTQKQTARTPVTQVVPEPVLEEEPHLELDVEAAMERGGRSFALPLIALLMGLGAGGWFLLGGKDDETGEPSEPLQVIDGNRISNEAFSFEDPAFDEADWLHEESAPRRLDRGRGFGSSGRFGVGLALDSGEWARLSSDWLSVRAGDVVRAEATAFAAPGCVARVGLEFAGVETGQLRILSSSALPAGERLTVASTVPAGRDRARVVLLAGTVDPAPEGTANEVGECGFDDVFFGSADASDVVIVRENESMLERSAQRPATISFDRLGRRLAILRAARGPLGASATPGPIELTPGELAGEIVPVQLGSASGPAVLIAELLPELFGEQIRSVGCLTEAGYREYSGEFTATEVKALRLGSGLEQVALALPAPAQVSASPVGEGLRVAIEIGAAREFEIQLGFTAYRGEATTLAAAARRAERDGELGSSLKRWEELVASYPFESEFLREAEGAVARLSEVGLAGLADVRRDLERASFFGLGELFDACEARARTVASRFASGAGSPNAVERAAADLIAEIQTEREELPMRAAGVSELRSEAIRGYLRSSGRAGVADELGALRAQGGGR